ncbi:divergent polysaccharide deacetylase family protein [Zophobihabitans entericus]|uniref:Divergent polysaccharide deacetylase family protein n=1 Tax=Zophobihabitans entericus TaxID=1635327 RepID=A0A6G9I956_9GAMM|nr:divergent polysaccharide deacetylase family protein [Zophobihabitans entericus]QIQ20254.1 divergent polysaccharide deacetylase family protein [Zophobihabitans entericus]
MKRFLLVVSALFICTFSVQAARLAIVIDDFGYRVHNEQQIIHFSPKITVAVLPNSPHAKQMATEAHQNGNEVIIHLPMAPTSKQPLEKDTIFPTMPETEIQRIIYEAVEKVPYAIGVNNHMGSLMTGNLDGMRKVMRQLNYYSLFFLDSRTIAKTQGMVAAAEYDIPAVGRDVFLDDTQTEESIAHQFNEAVRLARRNGSAVAIGHPYSQTVNVLRDKIANLPDDIELVPLTTLLPPAKNRWNLGGFVEKVQDKIESTMFEVIIEKNSR